MLSDLRSLGGLQGVNELFLFAEKRIQRFDESRFKKQRFMADVICFSNFVEMFPIHGMCK